MRLLMTACLTVASMGVYAVGNNPASVDYVDTAIERAYQSAVSQTIYTAGTAISIVNNVVSGNYQSGNGILVDNTAGTISVHLYTVGDTYEGGTIFYIDGTAQHGLIFSTVDGSYTLGAAALVDSTSNVNVSAEGTAVGTGIQNTAIWNAGLMISSNISTTSPATNAGGVAEMAAAYSVEADGTQCPAPSATPNSDLCFGGYYLPSLAELELLVQSGELSFPAGVWWTSTSDPVTAGNAFAIEKSGGTNAYEIQSRAVTQNLLTLPIRQF